MSDDDLIDSADGGREPEQSRSCGWKVAVVDGDPAVHEAIRVALADVEPNGRGGEILSAQSAAEARALLRRERDVAVILLAVALETDTAGLDLVEFVRCDLGDALVRIVLRIDAPGRAPARRIVVDHDIDDYTTKAELTADRLSTMLTAALRAHGRLVRLEESRRGLEMVIDAATTLFDSCSMRRFAEGVLIQVASLLEVACAGMLIVRDVFEEGGGKLAVLAGSGVYSENGRPPERDLEGEVGALVDRAFVDKRHDFLPDRSILYIPTASGREIVVVLDVARPLSPTDRALVEMFCGKLSVAFENVQLYEKLQAANLDLEARVAKRTRELTELAVRLADQREILRRANSFKIELLGMIAHDLKNPLAAVLGRVEIAEDLLDREGVTPAAVREQIGKIAAPARAMLRMISDLVGQATADALDVGIHPRDVDLAAIVCELVDEMRPIAARKRQIVELDAPRPVAAHVDPDRIREAIENVISNAFKYGPLGGAVGIAVRAVADRAVVSVADQGPGLTKEDLERLFGRFRRLSAQPTAGESSTGLGLAIAKQIVDVHGGHIATRPADPGPGTVFEIVLPASRSRDAIVPAEGADS